MRDGTVARKYAEALFELGLRDERIEAYGTALRSVADLLESEPRFRLFLDTPRIEDSARKVLVREVFGATLPRHVLNFVLVAIDKRRQRLLRSIADEYDLLVDTHLGREHVEVTVARPLDEATSEMVAQRLSKVIGKKAIPHIRVKPDILGGLVVRTGDTIYDGSVRRRLEGMRGRMLKAELPTGAVDATR
ncbi:MAG: ATP synthase F1 subunit delta [Gemmatimonadota bacterium]